MWYPIRTDCATRTSLSVTRKSVFAQRLSSIYRSLICTFRFVYSITVFQLLRCSGYRPCRRQYSSRSASFIKAIWIMATSFDLLSYWSGVEGLADKTYRFDRYFCFQAYKGDRDQAFLYANLLNALAIMGHHFTNDVVFKFSVVGWHNEFTPTASKDWEKKLKDRTIIVTEGGPLSV